MIEEPATVIENIVIEPVREEVIEKEQEQIIDVVSHQIFAKVQTQLPTILRFQEKIIDGKVYKIHMPTDPQEKFLCDGCQ